MKHSLFTRILCWFFGWKLPKLTRSRPKPWYYERSRRRQHRALRSRYARKHGIKAAMRYRNITVDGADINGAYLKQQERIGNL